VIHRHLNYAADTAVEQLGPAALDDLVERGDLADWAPLAAAVARDPFGELAATVEQLCDAHPMYGTSPLWRAFIDRARARVEGPHRRRLNLAAFRRAAGVTQATLAARLGMSQSDLSKLERRADLRLSTLRSYVAGLGGQLALLADLAGVSAELEIGAHRSPSAS
jgi:DNA-binding XRE family transcriptional regulator